MLSLLSLTLGLSFLCGLNLYLATAVVSLSVRQGWVDGALHPGLAALGHPAILTVALVLMAAEFILDKIPWVDSFWDAIHTVIRPAGAVALSLGIAHAAGWSSTTATVVAGAALVLALSSHLTKSGVRLLINASPEPFTNILASLAEDLAVLLLMGLLLNAPVTGFAACLTLLAATWIALPRMWRLVKVSIFLLWTKCFRRVPRRGRHHGALPAALTTTQERLLTEMAGSDVLPVAWAISCVSGKAKALPGHHANRFGTLVLPAAHPGVLFFVSKGWFRRRAVRISLAGATIRQESSFLSENLVIHRADDGLDLVFRFTRAEAPLLVRLVEDLNHRLGWRAPLGTGLDAMLPPPLSDEATQEWKIPPPLHQHHA